MKHQKHTKLTRPNLGNFARQEWSIIGTPCGDIKKLAFQLTNNLSSTYKVTYIDADHPSGDHEAEQGRNVNSAMAHGANMEYTDKITYHQFDTEAKLDSFQFRMWMNEQDVALVNGNHFKAKQQIVVIDPRKEKSLKKKLDRLSDVVLILKTKGVTDIPDFLKAHLDNWANIPTKSIDNINFITSFLKEKLEAARPALNGLVLAGGKSTRMGKDKGLLDYHGKPQREYTADLLSKVCDQVFLSCRADQSDNIQSNYPLLPDTFTGLGPFGAILSAFRDNPNRAWLVVACDLPLLDADTLNYLMSQRNPSAVATAFHNPATNFPEPLITIWEPKSYPILFQFLAQGYSCPRKVLINSEIHTIQVPNITALKNVNTPEERAEVFEKIEE